MENLNNAEMQEINGGGFWSTLGSATADALEYVAEWFDVAADNHTKVSGGATYQNRLP